MIVWSQDGLSFICMDSGMRFAAEKAVDGRYIISANDKVMGTVETEDDARNILIDIVANYVSYVKECDVW